jgi:hypothetical protein
MTRWRIKLARLILPKTHAVVPKEPTHEMTRAAARAMSPGHRPTQEWVSARVKHIIRFQAMVEAAE